MTNTYKNIYSSFLLIFFTLLMGSDIQATHIIGGDITYRYLGDNNYEITLNLRRDCRFGQVGFDPFASISIFKPEDNTLIDEIRVPFMASDTVGNTIESNCGFFGDAVCVQTTTYRTTTKLIYRDAGYIISYQRCCRNQTLRNIDNPLEVGTTEWIFLSPEALLAKNSSPTFTQWPEVYICANRPLVFDHPAVDSDRDSLVYKVCKPFSGATLNNPQPQPSFPPPFSEIEFANGYSINNFMGGTPLMVNAETGLITATPDAVGQYLIGVCIEEYRDGRLLSTVRRNFQYNVVICADGIKGDFVAENNICDSLEVVFTNNLIGASSFEWNFNFPSADPTFISTEVNPTFRYSTAGEYTVRLLARSSTGACDTIISKQIVAREGSNIKDLNLIDTSFTICLGDTLNIVRDTSLGYVYSFEPSSGIDLTDPKNPKIIGLLPTSYTVTVLNQEGCEFTGTITTDIFRTPNPLVIDGPENVCENNISLVASGGYGTFEWATDSLFTNIISNKDSLNFTLTQRSQDFFVRSVSPDGCGDVINHINVTNQTPDVDFENPSFICRGGQGIVVFENLWPNHTITYNFNDPHVLSISNDTMRITSLPEDMDSIKINGQIINQFGCSKDIEITILFIEVKDIDFSATLKSCEDHTMCFEISGVYSGQVQWTFGSGLAVDTSILKTPCFTYENGGAYQVTLSNPVSNCPFDPIIKTIEVPQLSDSTVFPQFTLTNCNEGTVCFDILGNYTGEIQWNFGDVGNPNNVSNLAETCYNYSNPGVYSVTLTHLVDICPFDKVTFLVEVPEKLLLNTTPNVIACQGQEIDLSVSANLMGTTFVWLNSQGDTIGRTPTINFVANENTVLTVLGTSPDGCTDDIQITIAISNLMLSVTTRPQVICIGEQFVAEVQVANSSDFTFDWEPKDCIISGDGTNMAFFEALADKKYVVVITEKSTGCQQTIEFTADLTQPIIASFEGAACEGQESNVNVVIEGPENYDFEWGPSNVIVAGGNTASPTINIGAGQTLTVVITDKTTGCSREFSYVPNVSPAVVINFTDPNVEIAQGTTTTINIRNPQSGTTYVWDNGQIGSSIEVEPLSTTTYTVTATDANGCTGVAQITINVRTITCTDGDEYLPNVFTPNNDTFNDLLLVKSPVITEMTLVIFNRWGQEVFRTNNINEGWDGTFQDKDCAPDAYAYYLQATCISGDSFVKRGNVTLIR